MQTKTTMTFNLTPIRLKIIKKTTGTNTSENVGESNTHSLLVLFTLVSQYGNKSNASL